MTTRRAFNEIEAVARAYANGAATNQVRRIDEALSVVRAMINNRSHPPSRPKAGPPGPPKPLCPAATNGGSQPFLW